MDSIRSSSKGIKFSSLESEVLLAELYCKLNTFPDPEKTKVVTSWLANSYADLTNTGGSGNTELLNCYIVHVRLFNTLANNSPFDKACQLAESFSKDFLTPFVIPSLTENGRNFSDATYYFQLACENITQPILVRKIMSLVISRLLYTLLSRLRTENTDVLVATLGLFKVLLEFYCEDLWYELILQYLLPMKHLMVSERQKSLPDISYTDSTIKFLDLIPDCIADTLSPDILAEHFTLYIQQELNRLNDIDSMVTKGVPLSKSEVLGFPVVDDDDDVEGPQPLANETDPNEQSPAFPLWTFKYDGSDVTRKFSFSEPEEYFEDDLFTQSPALFNIPEIKEGPQTENNDTVSILNDHDVSQAASTLESNQPQKSENVTRSAYLGPFIDSLYKLLNDWTRVEPDVIVILSEILSVLASSRIPLISHLMLDLSIILQPCYPSFSAIVHTIKNKLDGSMKKCPNWFIKNIWQKSSIGSSAMLKSDNDGPPQGNTLKERFLKSHPFSFVSKLSKDNSLVKLFTNNSAIFNENRILNRTASGFETENEEIMAKKMTLRCILFTHWLLELAAIAQQICWSQSRKSPTAEY